MKRTFNTIQNSNNSSVKPDAVLEGVVVSVTDICDNNTDKKGKYWTALICDSNQNINRITKYLSSKIKCSLHVKMIEYLHNQNGVKLNKLKCNGDNIYTATSETIAAPKQVLFIPLCTQISSVQDIQSMSDGQYVSVICKIIDIGPDDTIVFNNGPKKVQKLKRTTIVADKTDSINMNIWQNQFDSIKQNLSYRIKLVKVKLFNDDISITTTVHTIFEVIDDIDDTNCSDSIRISYESSVVGVITSIGLVDERLTCPKCYSMDVECHDKTIKCITCKSRSLYLKESSNHKQIKKVKLSIFDTNQNLSEHIVDISQIQVLLEQCNHKDLCEKDLIEDEEVLIFLSTINVSVNFDLKTNRISSIVMSDIDNRLNKTT